MQPKWTRTSWSNALGVCTWCVGACFASTIFAKAPVCPPGQRPGISGCRSGAPELRAAAPTSSAGAAAPAASRPSPGSKNASPKAPPPPDASLRPPNSLERADKKLLIEEIARLENLLKVTHPNSPDRPMLLMRLAGAYSELRTLSERDYTRLEMQVQEMERAKRATPPINKQLAPETTGPSRRLTL